MRGGSTVWLVFCVACAARGSAAGPEEEAAGRAEIQRLESRIAEAERTLGWTPPPAAGGRATRLEEGGFDAEETAPPAATEPAPPLGRVAPAPTTTPERPAADAGGGATAESRFASPPPPIASSCENVCRSSRGICTAAHRICRIAGDLGEAWADERCEVAQRSCRSASSRADERCGCE